MNKIPIDTLKYATVVVRDAKEMARNHSLFYGIESWDVVHVTPEELNTLRQRLIELFGEYRRLDPDARPPGARRILTTVDLVPWFPPPSPPSPDGDQP